MNDGASRPPKAFTRMIPAGDNRERAVCADCGFINYENPKIVVGVVARWQGRYLMCRRAIHPRKGFWTIPAGYLELNETAADGAKREAREEAMAEVALDGLLAVYSIPRLSQIQVIYRGSLIDGRYAPGPESVETALFAWAEIPWSELAFPSVRWALDHARAAGDEPQIAAQHNPPGETGDY